MVHCAVLHTLRFVDLLEAELFVEADGGVEFGVRLDVERFIARVSGGLLDGFGQTSADALALGRVGEVELLQLRAAVENRRLGKAAAAEHRTVFADGDEVAAAWFRAVKRAQMVELGVKYAVPGMVR